MSETDSTPDVAALTVQLLSAYLANNTVASEELAGLIRTTRAALTEDGTPSAAENEAAAFVPAVSARKSLASPDYIVSLIDGKRYKTLKRHLASHGLTPDSYRARYQLPATYPMVAPTYAAHRRAVAQKIGLGSRKPTSAGDMADIAELDDDSAKPASMDSTAEVSDIAVTSAPDTSDTKQAQPRAAKAKADTAPRARKSKAAEGEDALASSTTDKRAPAKRRAKASADAAPSKDGDGEPAADAANQADAPAAASPKPKGSKRGKIGLFRNSDAQGADDAGTPATASADADAAPAPAKPTKRMARTPKPSAE